MSEAATGIWPPEAVRTLDRTATSAFGIAGYELMRRLLGVVAGRLQATRLQVMDTYWPAAKRAGN